MSIQFLGRVSREHPLHAYSFIEFPIHADPPGCPTCSAPVNSPVPPGLAFTLTYECGTVYRWEADVPTRMWRVTLLHLGTFCGWTYEGDGDAPNPV